MGSGVGCSQHLMATSRLAALRDRIKQKQRVEDAAVEERIKSQRAEDAEVDAKEKKEREERRKIAEQQAAEDKFIPSEQFAGAKPGYVFRAGRNGTGYYIDSKEEKAKSQAVKENLLRQAGQRGEREHPVDTGESPETKRARLGPGANNGPSTTGEVKFQPVCRCGLEAKRGTSGKAGADQGREFYSCPKPRGEGCGAFRWADENNEPAGLQGMLYKNGTQVKLNCKCGATAQEFVCQKEGNNKGRKMYKCRANFCGWMAWVDEINSAAASASAGVGESGAPAPVVQKRCKCSADAVLRTVKKEGPNLGRKFWACNQPQQCSFFEFEVSGSAAADRLNDGAAVAGAPAAAAGPPAVVDSSTLGSVITSVATVNCNCKVPAKGPFTCKKEGQNFGRRFWKCGANDHCRFFSWGSVAESLEPPGIAGGAVGGAVGGGAGGGAGSKMTCFKCGEVGHYARACQAGGA